MSFVVLARHIISGNTLFTAFSCSAVPTFFIVSGFFYVNSADKDAYLKRNVKRLLILYIVWSVLYIPFGLSLTKEDNIVIALLKFIQSFLFSGLYWHLWFVPALIIAMIVSHCLFRILNNKAVIIIAVILYIVGLFGDSYSVVITNGYILSVLENYRQVFITTRNGLFFGVLPFVLGGLLLSTDRIKKYNAIILLIIGALLTILEFEFLKWISSGSISRLNMLIGPMIIAIMLCYIFKNVEVNISITKARSIGQISTVLYMCHIGVISIIDHFSWRPELAITCKFLAPFILAVLIVILSNKKCFAWLRVLM